MKTFVGDATTAWVSAVAEARSDGGGGGGGMVMLVRFVLVVFNPVPKSVKRYSPFIDQWFPLPTLNSTPVPLIQPVNRPEVLALSCAVEKVSIKSSL